MAPAAQAEASGSLRHATDRQELWSTVPEGYMKGRTWPKSGPSFGLIENRSTTLSAQSRALEGTMDAWTVRALSP